MIGRNFQTRQPNSKTINQEKMTKKEKESIVIELCAALGITFKPGGWLSGSPTAIINKGSPLLANADSINKLHDFIKTNSLKINGEAKGKLPKEMYDEIYKNAENILKPIISYEGGGIGNEDSQLKGFAFMLVKLIEARTDNTLYSSSARAVMDCLSKQKNAVMHDNSIVNETFCPADKDYNKPSVVYSNPGWSKPLVAKATPNPREWIKQLAAKPIPSLVNFKVANTIDSIAQFLLVLPTTSTKQISLDSVACGPAKANPSRVWIDFNGKYSDTLALDKVTGSIFYQNRELQENEIPAVADLCNKAILTFKEKLKLNEQNEKNFFNLSASNVSDTIGTTEQIEKGGGFIPNTDAINTSTINTSTIGGSNIEKFQAAPLEAFPKANGKTTKFMEISNKYASPQQELIWYKLNEKGEIQQHKGNSRFDSDGKFQVIKKGNTLVIHNQKAEYDTDPSVKNCVRFLKRISVELGYNKLDTFIKERVQINGMLLGKGIESMEPFVEFIIHAEPQKNIQHASDYNNCYKGLSEFIEKFN
jgi:hypothetical protein